MLLKLITMKNDDVVELDNNKRELSRKNNQLQMEVLAWKSHASRADDQLLIEKMESSLVIVSDCEGSNPNKRK